MDFTPPPGLDLSESKRANLYAAYSSTYGLAVVAVVLRLLCRTRVSKVGLWWDDYLICIALAMVTGEYIDMIIWVYRGVGTHIYPLGMTGFSNFFINLFVCEIFYTLSICLTKYSILMFYWRIFGTTNIRIPIYVIFFLVTGWGLGVIFTTIFQCLPIRGFWDKSLNPHCGVDVNQFFIGNAVPNIITDWALLILPMPYIWRLHKNTAQKIAISSVFVLGGFICVISIVRLVIMLDSYRVPSIDVTWVFIGPSTWTAVETNIGVVSACLPSLRPLLRLLDRDHGTQDSDSSPKKSAHSYGTLSSTGKRSKRSKMQNDSELHLSTIDVTTTVDIEETYRY
ncbi:hypothetical protein IFM58399_07297 [Aspergillus lentulus]|uniref:putative integral membrane protein n=1 Tax=Aspergillus lentulus TaxID=293939 RepID=UPI001393AAF8|nr:uncharacterized protein IFM58399_07297 [Aspergillus lentulus]GFF44457.1 hypothetical protein IFM58399_07297 [Aspergillus lentulus]GFF64319.1 hypothetical protein IFM62136_05923 [Aspergillus lentulus]GFG15345.1 hypothetical protein IFM61392_08929 [Aspergillus lentulus]